MIEKSNQVQMNSRELQVGGIATDRFLVNGLIRVGRKAKPSNAQRSSSVIGNTCASMELRACRNT